MRFSRVPMRLRWRFALAFACALFMPSGELLAQPTAKVVLGRWARGLRVGRDMDARGVKLYGSELVDQDLRNARFDHCVLYGVRFVECNLTNSFFRGAVLGGASISGCWLDHADFTDAIINDMDMTDSFLSLTPAQLVSTYSYKKKDLRKTMICGMPSKETGRAPEYDFRRADLSGAKLCYGAFTKCDFTGATMYQATIRFCVASFASLSPSKTFREGGLREFTLANIWFVDACDFSGMDLTGARLSCLRNHVGPGPLPLNLTDALIQGATFENDPVHVPMVNGEHLRSTASYRQGDLSGIQLYDVDLAGVDLSNQNLTKAAFGHCDLTNVDFTGAVITGADFVTFRYRRDPTKGLTADQIKSTWNYKHGRMEGIRLPPEIAQALRSEKE